MPQEGCYAMGRHFGWFHFSHVAKNGERGLILQHNHGPKWSLFLGHYMAAMLRSVLAVEPETQVEDSLATITFK